MLSRSPDEPVHSTLQQKMLSNAWGGKGLDVKFEPSAHLVDFLDLCTDPASEPMLERLHRVGLFRHFLVR